MGYFIDAAQMTVSGTPGTGTITLGAAVLGYRTFAAAGLLNGQVISYAIQDVSGAYEFGRGTYTTSGTTLARTTILGSSNSNAAINATAAAIVSATALAEDITPVSYMRGFKNGMTLSNDVGTPNTILDIAAGTCIDSTNAAFISLGAFTKTTGGTWVVGTGNAGMGQGLTIGNSTWYHVFAIINAGLADVYFDTSVTAANAPTGTTYFRRIGSFKTDGSAHIVPFIQDGGTFQWVTDVLDINSTNPGTSAVSRTLASVPLGIRVKAIMYVTQSATSTADIAFGLMTDLSVSDVAPTISIANFGNSPGVNPTGTWAAAAQLEVYTNTAQAIRSRLSGSGATTNLKINTHGWVDSFS